jgi:hypothetical protein
MTDLRGLEMTAIHKAQWSLEPKTALRGDLQPIPQHQHHAAKLVTMPDVQRDPTAVWPGSQQRSRS